MKKNFQAKTFLDRYLAVTIALLLSFAANSQTPYVPNNPDSVKLSSVIGGQPRSIYVTDLTKSKADKSKLPVNSLNYATGNGITDDAAALSTWLSSGASLYLADGIYKIGSQLLSTAARNNVTITCSKNAVIVPTSSFSQTVSCFRIENVTNLKIIGLNIQGNGDIASPALTDFNGNTYGLYVKTCTNVTIEKCYFSKQAKGAVYAESCGNVRLVDNEVPQTYNYGFWIKTCTDVLAKNNVISGQGALQHDATTLGQCPGILTTSCDRVLFEGNNANDFKNDCYKTEGSNYVTYLNNTARNSGKDGLKITGLSGSTIKKAVVIGNTIEYLRPWAPDGNALILLVDAEEYTISGNIIRGGIKGIGTGGQQENGINVHAEAASFISSKGVISNNIITGVGYNGIYVATIANTVISNNEITDYAVDATDSKGINVDVSSSNMNVSNNIINQTTQPSTGSSNGIRFFGTNSKIINNTIQNAKDVGILSTLSNGLYFEVSGNTITGSGQQGIFTSGTGTVSVIKYSCNTVLNSNWYPIDFGTSNLTVGQLVIENSSISTTNSNNWLRFFGSGTVSLLTLSNNTISGNSLESPTYTMQPSVIQKDGWYRTLLNADVTNNNAVANTIADITGLSFNIKSGVTYRFRFFIHYNAAPDINTGSRWSINGPATSFLAYRSEFSFTSGSRTFNDGLSGYNLPAASNTTSPSTNGANTAIIEGTITPSADGTVIGRFASEVAGAAITAKANVSYVEYRQVN